MLGRTSGLVALVACSACSGAMSDSATKGESADWLTPPAALAASSNGQPSDTPMIGGGLASSSPEPAMPSLPAEQELSFEFELPHAGEQYVYAVNPDSDTVAVIDADTLAIQGVEAGDQPTFLQTLAGRDEAVVLNVRSSDATLIRTANGASQTLTVPVQSGANAIAVAPDGKHAIVYFNAANRGSGSSGSFQDISVLFLEQDKERSEAMTVGFRPSQVSFSADGKHGYVVTEDGVSLIDFAKIEAEGPSIARTVSLGDNTATSQDVSITPDGKYALARREGESLVRLADLESGDLSVLDLRDVFASSQVQTVDGEFQNLTQADAGADAQVLTPSSSDGGGEVALGDAGSSNVGRDAGGPPFGNDASADSSVPIASASPTDTAIPVADAAVPPLAPPIAAAITDLDLAPSGSYALAVVRDQNTVIQLDIPGAFTTDSGFRILPIGDELVGSVQISPDSERALLYTTAVPTHERLSVLDIASGDYLAVRLTKSVQSVTIAPDSRTAIVVHQKLEGDPNEFGIDPDVMVDRSFGYSILDLASGFSKLQVTDVAVGPTTIVPDGSNLFALFNDATKGLREVHQVNLQSFVVQHRLLGSPPTSLGSVPGSEKVFVGQEHPDGRISFIDWETGEIESVTGFELNSRIRE